MNICQRCEHFERIEIGGGQVGPGFWIGSKCHSPHVTEKVHTDAVSGSKTFPDCEDINPNGDCSGWTERIPWWRPLLSRIRGTG